MASLYRRTDSPYWWVSFLDVTGKRRCKSTGLKTGLTLDSRKARDLCRELTAAEGDTSSYHEAWDVWVPQFLEQRYATQQNSLERYQTAWRNVRAFLRENSINVPRALTRQHVRAFIGWRQQPQVGVYTAGKNTALLEIKLLGLIVQEAIHNDFATHNPCHKLGIGRAASVPKPRITDAEHAMILAALDQEPVWMRTSYLIAWEQGCRFSETHMHLPTQVDIIRGIVRFRTKGQKDTLAEFPMSPKLVPLFKELAAKGMVWTYDIPTYPAKLWWYFFRRVGLPHLCFHAVRVTWITRAYEAGIPREHVMRLCGHTTYAAHQIYPRIEAGGNQLQELMQRVADGDCSPARTK